MAAALCFDLLYLKLDNIFELQVMTTFMSPPSVSTFLVFHPLDNNIFAIGMEDSTIHIYNGKFDEVFNLTCSNFYFFVKQLVMPLALLVGQI